jgi:O-antigen ligase
MSWALALDRPITGGGFDFQSPEVFGKYAPDFMSKYNGKIWNTHNIFLSILAGHGFGALIAFLAMVSFCLMSCARLKRQVRGRPALKWVKTYAEMIQLSFIAFLVNGMFVNMEYFDLPYHWIAVVATLKVIVARELAEAETESSDTAKASVALAAG